MLCAALNVLDDEIIKAAQATEPKQVAPPGASKAVPSSRPAVGALRAAPPNKMPMPLAQPQGGVNAAYRGPNQATGPPMPAGPGGQPNPQMYQQQPPQQRGPPPPQAYRVPPQQGRPMPPQAYAPPPQQRGPGGPVPASGRRF